MQGLGILILIVLGFWLLWPIISRWLRRQAANKAEDFIRNATGMPPRPGSRRARKEQKARANSHEGYNNGYYDSQRRKRKASADEPLIPKEYAEDVEFVETKDFSSDATNHKQNKKEIYHEKQVSDAEWVEVKDKKN